MSINAVFEEEELSREYTEMARTQLIYDTAVVGNARSVQQRNINRYDALRGYTIDFSGMNTERKKNLYEFYLTKWGRAIGFRFYPPFDRDFDHDLIGVGDGTTTSFYLSRNYFSRGFFQQRRILKPIHPLLTITENGEKAQIIDPFGTITPAGAFPVSSNPITVDWTIGKITFQAAPAAGALIYAESGQFNVPVYFDTDAFDDSDFGPFANAEGIRLIEIPPGSLTSEGNATPDCSLAFTAPMSGTQVPGTFDVSLSASGLTEVQLYLDGSHHATDSSSPFSFASVPRPTGPGEKFEAKAIGINPSNGKFALAKIALLSLLVLAEGITYVSDAVTYESGGVTYTIFQGVE